MRRRFHSRSGLVTVAGIAVLSFVMIGCAERASLPTAPLSSLGVEGRVAEPLERVPENKPGTQVEYCQQFTPFAQAKFTHPRQITNQYSPLVPGTQYTLTGQANRGLGFLPHDVVFTVTDVIKDINGIECVTLWDRDFQNGVLAEEELAFFAQDDAGNIWMMGEYPEEFDLTSGEFLGAPNTWIAGIEGTIPGTLLLGEQEQGTGYYLQARAPSIRFLDCAKVYKTGERDCVPVGCFDNVLVTDERAPADWRGGHQRKFYAPGVGNIRVDFRGDPEGEVLVMTARKQLTPAELAEARQAVLRLDARGHRFNDRYALTSPAR